MDPKKTGKFLKELRTEKGMTQEQLARQFNVSNRSVSRWETGSNLPDISLLVEIADFYDVDVRELIDGGRKSENMDKDIKEVADKMASYATNEKSKLLRFIQIISIVAVAVLFLAMVFQSIDYQPGIKSFVALLLTFVSMVFMGIITLYVTGLMKKLFNNKKGLTIVTVVISILMGIGALQFVIIMGAVGLVMLDSATSKIVVQTDPSGFNGYIHTKEQGWGNQEIFDVLPQTLEGLNVTEYQLTYYNPWDAQYIVYFTVDYDGTSYDEEMSRLKDIGIEEYKGIYTVTGEPDGFDLVAMNSDEYNGFVYAMIPEDSGEDNTKITYAGIYFCNYFLDLDIHKYIPDEYLLPGFDATSNNPYKIEREKKAS